MITPRAHRRLEFAPDENRRDVLTPAGVVTPPLEQLLTRSPGSAASNPVFPSSSPRLAGALLAAAAVPVLGILIYAFLVIRNVAYWDEMDSAIALLLKVQNGAKWQEIISYVVSLTNEHRTATSRALYLASYGLTGTINFAVLGWVGLGCLVGACALLIATAGAAARKIRLAVLLAFLLFQLQHYENLFWAGSSIDHFQIILLATGAFVALARPTRLAFLAAVLLALLATLTLAHGLAVWGVGAGVLGLQRRWDRLACWVGVATVATGLFFQHYHFNAAHHIGAFSSTEVGRIAHYWLVLLGAPLALGDNPFAPVLGLGLLTLFGRVALRRTLTNEPIFLPLALWAMGALFLIAIGRGGLAAEEIPSRYYVLGSLAWALVLFVEAESWEIPQRPLGWLARALPLLVVFNAAADIRYASFARSWIICRNTAAEFYMRNGRDGVGPHTLYPDPVYATSLLRRAEEKGLVRMPEASTERKFPKARLVENLNYYFDRITVDDRMISIEGWAGFPDRKSLPQQIHVILRSTKSNRLYTTLSVERGDVEAVHHQQAWRQSGFHFLARRWLIPPEHYQVGLLIRSDKGNEFVMTAHELDMTGVGVGSLATGS
ncbi:MAG: hypothetical protein RIQ93_205 [Verrucomicrobiota bacterium]|jgi:hypothetical protein